MQVEAPSLAPPARETPVEGLALLPPPRWRLEVGWGPRRRLVVEGSGRVAFAGGSANAAMSLGRREVALLDDQVRALRLAGAAPPLGPSEGPVAFTLTVLHDDPRLAGELQVSVGALAAAREGLGEASGLLRALERLRSRLVGPCGQPVVLDGRLALRDGALLLDPADSQLAPPRLKVVPLVADARLVPGAVVCLRGSIVGGALVVDEVLWAVACHQRVTTSRLDARVTRNALGERCLETSGGLMPSRRMADVLRAGARGRGERGASTLRVLCTREWRRSEELGTDGRPRVQWRRRFVAHVLGAEARVRVSVLTPEGVLAPGTSVRVVECCRADGERWVLLRLASRLLWVPARDVRLAGDAAGQGG